MDFEHSVQARELKSRVGAFVESHVIPAERPYAEELAELGDPHGTSSVVERLKRQARDEGLWNLFHPDSRWGAGLSNVDYAPIAELTGRSPIGPEVFNCSPPDTGNMELLSVFGTRQQQERWLQPLLDGSIRSAFAMTEPGVASADATNVETEIRRDGDEYVITGRKWWTTGVLHPLCRFLIVMGKTDPQAAPHRQQTQVLVPLSTPGLNVIRSLSVFGYEHHEGHGEVVFDGVRVPCENRLGEEGEGFRVSQVRLGPGRIHHCMRALGAAERALELLCARALSRSSFGSAIAARANVQDWIAESRVDLEMGRLLVLKAAWLMDTGDGRAAQDLVAASKVAVPSLTLRILDRAIQVHGGMGVSEDVPLAAMWAHARTLRILDGPDEVHKMTIARAELRRFDPEFAR